jgi:methionine sulfoxide reductase heme-binding subunit
MPISAISKRAGHIGWLTAVAIVVTAGAASLSGARSPAQRISIGTAYAALSLLGFAMALGPWTVLRGRLYPTSTRLRRDSGIASACLAIVHTIAGLQVHMGGKLARYFVPNEFARAGQASAVAFFLSNYAGFISAVVLIALATISNDRSIRRLGARRWKRWQRLAYAAAGLVALHGILYIGIERRVLVLVTAFAAVVLVVVGVQLSGRHRFQSLRADAASVTSGQV